MYEVIFLLVLTGIWILFATIQDLRKREIADWLNFSLIIFALGFRFFYSLFSDGDFAFFYQGLIGVGFFFILGNLFYYSHVFAGGDAKLLIALGAILPLSNSFFTNLWGLLIFLFIFSVVGTIYGLAWSFILLFKNFKKCNKEFHLRFNKKKKWFFFYMLLGLFLMILGFFLDIFFFMGIVIFVLPFFHLYAKVIDDVCMIKKVESRNLVIGDWLYKDLKIKKQMIKVKWEGLGDKDIKLIQKNKSFVLIRQGIAFAPVFLISFCVYILLYFLGYSFWEFYVF